MRLGVLGAFAIALVFPCASLFAEPLTASAGPDQSIAVGASARLSGVARGGAGAHSFQWVLIAGPEQTLQNAGRQDATVVGLKAGTSVYQLVVTDHLSVIARDEMALTVTRADPRICDFTPVGLIHDRWIYLDGADGPLGCATGPEVAVEGTTAQRMPFEHGEIVYSPNRGPKMLVAVYQHDDNIIVNWGDTAPKTYEKFLVRLDRDGVNVGQFEVDSYVDQTNGFYRIHTEPPQVIDNGPLSIHLPEWFLPAGQYAVIVEGCNGSDCDGWTHPAFVDYTIPPVPTYPCPAMTSEMQPSGLIGDRWARLGGAEGPLGCPVGAEHTRPGTAVRVQQFANGEIVFDPAHGESMTLAAYLAGGAIHAVWGNTAPYAYEKFIVRLDHEGGAGWYNAWQDDLGRGRSGAWSKSVSLPGLYAVIVEGYGCDEDFGPDTCNESFTAPAFVHNPPPARPPTAPPPPSRVCLPAFQPYGLIGERWTKLGAGNGFMGCPLGPEGPMPGSATARVQAFEHGEIVFSPDQGPNMVLSAYQIHESIVVDWGNTANEYERFALRLDYEGRHVGQAEIEVPGIAGRYAVPWFRAAGEEYEPTPTLALGAGRYSIIVEGCNGGCAGFTVPVSVNYRRIGDIDFSGVPTPRTVADALSEKKKRALIAARAITTESTGESEFGDGEVTIALAKLFLVDETTGEIPRANRARFNMKTEVNNALRFQKIWSNSGTTAACRTGDYDAVMKGYIPMLYRFRHLLAPDVRYRVLRLINKHGPFDPGDMFFSCYYGVASISFPETENHLLLIESTRYLMNQFMFKAFSDPKFDNAANGLDAIILAGLQTVLKYDFIEYNSRPYQRYSWAGIQNLSDYAENPKVRTAARMVLDYLSAKVATSSNDARRNPPFRRVQRYYTPDLFNARSDPIKSRFLLYTAPTPVMKELWESNRPPHAAGAEIVLAAATYYEPPQLLLDVMLQHRPYFQRFRHAGAEVYAGARDFLISGGGIFAGKAYTVAGFGDSEDIGVVQPTVLMPTGQFTTTEQMIRFETPPGPLGFVRAPNPGLCVAPRGFACGYTLLIPPHYLRDDKRQCWYRPEADPKWTFIDSVSPECAASENFGFYAVVYGEEGGFGFFEAVPKSSVTGTPLSLFAALTLARNRTRVYGFGTNTYTAWAGNDLRFDAYAENPIISTGIPDFDSRNPSFSDWPLAQGDLVNSAGHSGMITIFNGATKDGLVLDFRDALNPKRMPPY